MVDYNGQKLVLKWYTSQAALSNTFFKENLCKLCKLKIKGFTTPIAVTKNYGLNFGYIMEYIETDSNRVKLSKFLYDEDIIFKSERAKYYTPRLIAEYFSKLHELGFCFMDISDDNIFINLKKPEVIICDCDNINTPGKSTVIGKKGFVAPEIRNEGSKPDIFSDLYSISVLLFKYIVGSDPFIENTEYGMNGEIINNEKIFLMNSDKIEENIQNNWNLLNEDLKKAFVKCFTTGLTDKKSRIKSKEWIDLIDMWMKDETSKEKDKKVTNTKNKKRLQQIYYVIDNSFSMRKENRLDAVNKSLRETINQTSKDIDDTKVLINILQFSRNANWIFETAKDISEITDDDIKLQLGEEFTNFNQACIKLDMKLTDNELHKPGYVSNVPVIILISDGMSIRSRYLDNLNLLKNNLWYQKSKKIAIGISLEDYQTQMLWDFVNNDSNLLWNINSKDLTNLIINITLTVTRTATQNEDEDFYELIQKMK